MIAIIVASSTPYAGRTFLSLSLVKKLREMDFDAGYIKPLGTVPVRSGKDVHDADAIFAKEVLGLAEPLEVISPFVLDYENQSKLLAGELKDIRKQVLSAFQKLKKKDFVIVAGANDLFEGSLAGLDALSLAADMKAYTLFVEPWRGDISADAIHGSSRLFGERFCGAILNKVPEAAVNHVKQDIKPFLLKKGLSVFGVFPKDRFLESVTVRQLTEILNGKLQCCEDKQDEHVENFLVGAMDVDSALTYFRKTPNKAVITGAHRSDIQLAAMETSTRCIIITGGLQTNDVVLGKAKATGTPILSVPDDTFSTIDKIEMRVGKTTIREPRKVERAKQIMDVEFDMFGFLKKLNKV
ncbi:MAG: DRTGG domain-containing protein [Nitrospirota bacterium]|nr:DRTGG domain-containing protein [Nitrospirota bacterium]